LIPPYKSPIFFIIDYPLTVS